MSKIVKKKHLQRVSDTVIGRFKKKKMAPTRSDPPRDLGYMTREGLLKDTVYCETCYKGGKYFITGTEDITAEVRMINNPDITNHEKTFEPYFNESGDETFYRFVDNKE